MRCRPGQAGSEKRVKLGNVDRGLEMGGLFVTFERLAVAFEPIVDGSLADISVRQSIVQCEGVIIAGEGFVQPTELFEGCGFPYVRRWMIPPPEGSADGGITTGRTRRWMDRNAARTYSSTVTRLAPKSNPMMVAILS
jgi:hypothetical protein